MEERGQPSTVQLKRGARMIAELGANFMFLASLSNCDPFST